MKMTAESNTLPDKNDKLERMWVSGFPISDEAGPKGIQFYSYVLEMTLQLLLSIIKVPSL